MQMVKATLRANPNNSVIGFKDNSSAIRGGPVDPLLPARPGAPCAVAPARRDYDLLLTAETHNFPCAVAPYPGARRARPWAQSRPAPSALSAVAWLNALQVCAWPLCRPAPWHGGPQALSWPCCSLPILASCLLHAKSNATCLQAALRSTWLQ